MMLRNLTSKMCVGTGFMAVDMVLKANSATPDYYAAGGSCGNVLSVLAMFGWECYPAGRIGNDSAGRLLVEDFQAAGVRTERLVVDDRVDTPVIVHRYGIKTGDAFTHRFEWTCPMCGSYLPRFRPTPKKDLSDAIHSTPKSSVLYLDRATPGSVQLATGAKSRGAIIVFEPPRIQDTPHFETCLKMADIVKVSRNGHEPTLFDARFDNVPMLIETTGDEGLRYKLNGFLGCVSEWDRQAAFPLTSPIDTCGSGDWLTAGFVHALFGIESNTGSLSDRIKTSLAFGQALASLNCQEPGARGLMNAFPRDQILELVALVTAHRAVTETYEPLMCRMPTKESSACKACDSGVKRQ